MLGEHAFHKINALRERLIDINARSVFVNAHPKKSKVKIDLYNLGKLCSSIKNKAVLHNFLFNQSFEMCPSKDLKINERENKKTVHLFRKNEAFKNDFNLDPLGFGYPLLLISPKTKNNTNSLLCLSGMCL